MATYNNKEEIFDNITDNHRIEGVVEIDFDDCFETPMEYINEIMTNRLIGDEYGIYLEDINYSLVGCNTKKQTILVKVDASAESFLDEIYYQ
jgi:hypothetical protein